MQFDRLNIKVMGYREALDYCYIANSLSNNKPFAIISIQETDTMAIKFKPGGKCRAALNIHFSDITNDKIYTDAIKSGRHAHELKLMTLRDAKRIKSFIDKVEEDDTIEDLIIHCHAGVSRSSAVAAGLTKAHELDDSKYFNSDIYAPNMYVYTNILKAYGQITSKQDYEQLFKTSKKRR